MMLVTTLVWCFDNSWSGTGSTFEFRTTQRQQPRHALKIGGSGDISFYEDTGTTPKLFWDASAESLGIGTSSPDSMVHISENTNNSGTTGLSNGGLQIENIEATSGSWSQLHLKASAKDAHLRLLNDGTLKIMTESATNAMSITQTGDVGIGTSSPSTALHVRDSGNPTLTIDGSDGAYTSFLILKAAGGGASLIRAEGGSNALVLQTNGDNERLRIDDSGNVGIGNSVMSSMFSSSQNLVVGTGSGNNGITVYSQSNAVGDIAFADATSDPAYYSGLIRYDHGLDAMRLFTSSDERLRIAADGSISTPTAGTNNVRLGSGAGSSLASGSNHNTVVGDEAGTSLTTGIRNTAVGSEAADALNTGQDNTAIGSLALSADTKGNYSTAIGRGALKTQNFASSTSAHNTAVGYSAGEFVTTGKFNTLIGSFAGDAITEGQDNILIGFSAGAHDTNLQTGSRNVLLGAYIDTTTTGATDAIGLGYNVSAEGGYTTLGVNTSDIRALHGVATWATVSDERYKKDIVDSEAGLSLN